METSASTGRGRGIGLAGIAASAGKVTTVPNIGAGWRPACMNSALTMMAQTAANATAPPIISFGLCRKMRIARPYSDPCSASLARRRRRGISSSMVDFLGTFLHLKGWFRHRGTHRWSERCDVALGLDGLRCQRQRDRHGGAFVDFAHHGHLATMQGNEALDDRHSETGA